jgi:hypothetical protein
MKILIAKEKENTLQKILADINGKASAHTLNGTSKIFELTDDAERKFDALGLPLSHRKEAEIEFMSGGEVAKSYKHSRIATRLNLIRGTKDWYLVSAEQGTIGNYGGYLKFILTAAQDAKVVSIVRRSYSIKSAPNEKSL